MNYNKKMSYKDFIKFVLPSILIMLTISVYTIVDGLFVSNFVGSDALAAINISMPLFTIAFAVGIMFSSGGGALISIKLGEKDIDKASNYFSNLINVGLLIGLVATGLGLLFQNQLISILGANESLSQYVKVYSFYMIISFPIMILKILFEGFLRAEGRPNSALTMSIIGGVVNIILDYIFIVHFKMGIAGAGLGTFLGNVVSVFYGMYYFYGKKTIFKYRISKVDWTFMLATLTNGSSEMVNEIAIAFTTYLFNILTLKYAGNAGVAAISVILYVNFLFSSIFIGLSTGIAPILSYHFGAKNTESLIELKKYSKKTLLILSPLMCIILLIFNPFLVSLFLKKTDIAYNLSTVGLSIFSFGFLFSGLNIYGSAYFTALSNGKISALISFGKTFIVFFIMSLILPKALGITGVWLIMPITEILTSFVVIKFIRTKSPDFIINRGIRV